MIAEAERQRIVDAFPWPNVRGKRCLDIGSDDAYLTRELEHRGAADVVTLDAESALHVHELDPDQVGAFDVVVGDDVLVRLSDPLAALDCIRRITTGMFLSAEPIELWSSVLGRGKPSFRLHSDGGGGQQCSFNGAAHKQMLTTAGFTVERVSRPYTVPADLHPGHSWRERLDVLGTRAVTGSWEPGHLHRALLARPHTG